MSRLKGYLSANIRAIILFHEFVAVAGAYLTDAMK